MQSLDLEFKRVLISSKFTKLASEFDKAILDKVSSIIDNKDDKSEFIVLSYLNDDNWVLVCLSRVYWSYDSVLHVVEVSELSKARLDLIANKKLGFVSSEGFKYMTLEKMDGTVYHIETEPGSSLEAMLAVITKLIKENGL